MTYSFSIFVCFNHLLLMLTVQDFTTQYEKLSDVELYRIHLSADDYSDEAKEALAVVIRQRGGLEKLTREMKRQEVLSRERYRIEQEVKKLAEGDTPLDFLRNIISSEILPQNEVAALVEKTHEEVRLNNEDQRVKPRTVMGSILGGAIASVVGGGLWGLLMVQTHRIIYFFVAGLALLSYGLIRFFTKQSKENIVVLVATLLSVAGALLIGQVIFEYFG